LAIFQGSVSSELLDTRFAASAYAVAASCAFYPSKRVGCARACTAAAQETACLRISRFTSDLLSTQKQDVHDFWNAASCGENLYLTGSDRVAYDAQARRRYALEPYILDFAQFERSAGQRVLEIGVGLGADHQRFAEAGADLFGVDLTERAIDHTSRRMAAFGLASQLGVGDAEHLVFPDGFFDRVYSWGVLHHTPATPQALAEVRRVLKPGGHASVMIYHKWSLVGIMLWLRYALFRLRPWLSLDEIFSQYLESPGTKAYSVPDARQLFARWSEVSISTVLSHGDLLDSDAGQRHGGILLSTMRRIWPRRLLKRFFPRLGLFMMIDARK
jgi:SAM-dependent methyltransferase